MPDHIIDLLINYGANPEQVVALRQEEDLSVEPGLIRREQALFTQNLTQLSSIMGRDTLIAQATLVLTEGDEEEEEESDEEDSEKTKGRI